MSQKGQLKFWFFFGVVSLLEHRDGCTLQMQGEAQCNFYGNTHKKRTERILAKAIPVEAFSSMEKDNGASI